MLTAREKIKMEIQNENYITAVEVLLERYNSTKNTDHLETIHNILSKPQISFHFADDIFNRLNETLISKNFDEIQKGHMEDKTGIAEFPVVGEDNNYSSIRAVVVKDGTNNVDIDDKITNKKELFHTIRFVQDEIQRYLCDVDGITKDITILNWGLTISIREHLLKGTKYEPANNNFKIKGTSLHFAAVVACVSKLFNLPINPCYIFTGAFDGKGEVQGITGLDEKFKLISKERPNTLKIFIPPKSKFNSQEQSLISSSTKFIEVENVSQLIEKVFNRKIQDIAKLDLDNRKKLARARIWAEYVGEKEITFSTDYDLKTEVRKCIVLHFIRPADDPTAFKIFPIDKVYQEFNGLNSDFIIFEGAVVNHYTGQLMTSNDYRQSDSIFGVRLGKSSEVIVFAAPRGSILLGYKCNFF